mmetsp:Transcript_20702/g.35575  ORF Transcript_20702/g.35575 Transcript_20702/m.35575 type:complete len:101 (-) Transcript_20702:270-572(-)
MIAIANSLLTNPMVPNSNGSMAPIIVIHEINPYDPAKDPTTKAALPAIDLLLLKNHLFEDPSRRPTKSANPSPKAMVDIETMPMGESLQNKSVEKSSTNT